MTHRTDFAQSIVDNIINGNFSTARSQIRACDKTTYLIVVDELADAKFANDPRPTFATIAYLKQLLA